MSVKERYKAAIEEVIAKAKAARSRESLTIEGGVEVYAYPHRDGVAWGINNSDGVNIWRGIRRPDGADEAEG